VDPAGVGGSDTTQPYFTTDLARAMGRAVDGDAAAWTDPALTSIDTPMVQLPGRFRTSCRSEPGGRRLEVTWTEDPADSRTLPGARGADLHLLDISLVMGDVVDQVRRQATTFSVPPTDD
jgi:hypothetical protein